MNLSLDAAFTKLEALTAHGPATPQQLRALANEVSAYAPGSVTVLYSGKLADGSAAGDVVKQMAEQDPNLRIIGKTQAAKFLESEQFQKAIEATFDCDEIDIGTRGTAANTFMEATDGLWGDLSARFAAETTGEVRAVIGKVDPERIFEVRELPELLNKDASIITHVEGVAISELQSGDNLSALQKVQAASLTHIGYTGLGFDSTNNLTGKSDFLNRMSNLPEYLTEHPEAHNRLNALIHNLDPSMKSGLMSMDKAGILNKLGPVGILLSLGLAANSAAAAETAGNRDEAIEIMERWAADTSGSFVGETAGAFLATMALAAAAAAGTTVALPLAAAIVLGATLVGGLLGGISGTALYEFMLGDWLKSVSAISPTLGTTPDPLVKTIRWITKDPLVLDLDGDGLEITPLKAGVMFDADGDTVKNASAWVGADDGLLARDLDGDGLIDSGRELFGDNTLLANGKTAAHGFAALADLDLGSVVNGVTLGARDGVIDARDACFNELRVWRDLDQDGVSQANELATLTDADIAAIGLSNTATSKNYGGDATQTRSGSFTRADGSEGEAGNFLLAVNYFERAFAPVVVSETARALPDFKGTGWVRDLREAATLEPGLIDLVAQADHAPTRAGYKAAIGDLIKAWALASDYASAGRQGMAQGYGLILSEPVDAQERGWMDVAIKADAATRAAFRAGLDETDGAKFDAMRERMVGDLEKLYSYEAFTGTTFLNWSKVYQDAFHFQIQSGGGNIPIEVIRPLSEIFMTERTGYPSSMPEYIHVALPTSMLALMGLSHVEALWQRLVDDVSANLMPALWLDQYLERVDLSFTADGVVCDFAAMDAALAEVARTDTQEGAMHLIDLYFAYGSLLGGLGWSGESQVRAAMQRGIKDAAVREAFEITGHPFFAAGTTLGSVGNDVFAGDTGANIFNALAGDDLLDGHAGNDTLRGDKGRDVIFGGDGDDTLYGGDGNDLLDGGAGTDYLHGDVGSDIYLFGKGDGQDVIYLGHDSAPGKIDTLQFKDDVKFSEVTFATVYSSLVIGIASTTDRLTVQGFLTQDDPANAFNPLQQIRFSDGTTLDLAQILAHIYAGTVGNDSIYGTCNADTINGQAGNDILLSRAGDDTLDGGSGADNLSGGDGDDILRGGIDNDFLQGDAGLDVLDGGVGNDTILGGLGSDIYLFGRGDGADTIQTTTDTMSGKIDTLRFKADVTADALVFGTWNSNTALTIKIAGTTDQVTVYGFFAQGDPMNSGNPLQQIQFVDGTTWDLAAILARLHAGSNTDDTIGGTSSADTITGKDGRDVLYGGGDNDTLIGGNDADSLYGETGNDVLDGGAGNDVFDGGLGSDTYRFGKGDGQDVIYQCNDSLPGKLNTLEFKNGITPEEVLFGTSGSALTIRVVGTTDELRVIGFMLQDDPLNAVNPLQQIRFADGTTWDVSAILARLHAGTDAADSINGTLNADAITGQGGSDMLNGKFGNDTLDGGAGTDYAYGGDGDDVVRGGTETDWLYGDAGNDFIEGGMGSDWMFGGLGNDTLDGGAGTDLLHGERGNDIFVFGAGYGIDTVRENDTTSGNTDVAQFMNGIVCEQIWFRHAGNHLEASLIGTADKLVLENWYLGSAYRVEQFKTADGRQLASERVEHLVQAMAAFTPPAPGQTTLPDSYQTALAEVIGVSWVTG